ncbi:MAG TPA: RecQ family ATP-dependent DNA helicase [Jiangellaceae bacterium]|nr:RecQ family ATP-dependent DNA helicase [Jiangellaceae bacterium]
MSTETVGAAATDVLRRLVGRPEATFHEGQAEAVAALVSERRRVLVVQRTGWGKSAVYLVATALLRQRGAGPTLIVSPLLALMRDQIAAAERAGVRAVTMNSANAQDWAEISAAIEADTVDLLLVSPERLNNPRFREEQLPTLAERAGLLVVDEAHCISDWGHDFRPDYRRIRDFLERLPTHIPVLATTATANERVVVDVEEQLSAGGAQVSTVRGSLARDSLRLGVLELSRPADRAAWLAAHLDTLPASGIIYTLTVSAAEDLATVLTEAGHPVRAYSGRTDPAERVEMEEALRENQVKALVATSALGMGFDKPDLGFVVHVGAPSSPVAYYQQVGRAGRATERADVLLLPGVEDADIWRYFATVSMPRAEQARAVVQALSDAGPGSPMSTAALETVVDIRRTRLELLLKVLDVEGAVSRVRGGWEATGRPWEYDAERYARVSTAREHEAESMRAYQRGAQCRMEFLQQALDDPSAAPCGRCDVCAGPWYPTDVPERLRSTTETTLARAGVPIETRAQWPSGMPRLGVDISGRIPAAEQVEPGRAVARFTDLGWGARLRALLDTPGTGTGAADASAEGVSADDALLQACVQVLHDWPWEHRPEGIVRLSSGHDALLAAVAAHLSRVGRLPDLGVLPRQHERPDEHRGGGNSAFRLAEVWDQWHVPAEIRERIAGLSRNPVVLLIDDVVDSRWTLTVAGRSLRQAGAGAVLPFVLAQRG